MVHRLCERTDAVIPPTRKAARTIAATACFLAAATSFAQQPATLAKSISPSTVAWGVYSTLTITLGNTGAAPLNLTAEFVDAIPPGMVLNGTHTGTCPGATVTERKIVVASGSQIPPGGCTITTGVTSIPHATIVNETGPLVTTGGTAPAASASLTVTANALTLAKTITPAVINAGETATLTIAIGNNNALPDNVSAHFYDEMPPGVSTNGVNAGTCPATVLPFVILMFRQSPIPAGGCTIVTTITSTTTGTVVNTTSRLAGFFSGGASPASASLTVIGGAPPPAPVSKTIVPASITAGGSARLTISLANPTGLTKFLSEPFTDPMPVGMTVASSGNMGSCPGVSVTPTLVAIPANAAIPVGGCTIEVLVTSATLGTVTNVTSTLATVGGTVGQAASAPLTVVGANFAIESIPTVSPLVLALMLLALSGVGAFYLRRRG